ncbi:hypothetical protein BDR07DRAFT_1483352 [Suillus spraguei]|nr:hypothetical protein BDR07DRAFT_1483352 [Suillus spraguei]
MPVALMGILSWSVYLSVTNLGYDPTVMLPKIPRHLMLPQTIPSIKVGDKTYRIIKPIFARAAIRGRATMCWHVQDPDTCNDIVIRGKQPKHPCFYVVKDTWCIAAHSSVEEEILEMLKDIQGVPKLVKSWDVQVSGCPDTTGPYAINAHHEIVGRGILHCDISLNNIMIYFEYTVNGIFARGLLIDYDYATKISKGTDCAVGRQDLTGTLMFMASSILLQYSEHGIPHEQTVAHDLESFVYVFIYICVMYDGAGDKLRDDKLFNQTIIGINMVMSFFGTKKGTGVLGPLI